MKKVFTEEFRRQAVELSNAPGYTIDKVAESMGCSKASIHAWRRDAKKWVAMTNSNRKDVPAQIKAPNVPIHDDRVILQKEVKVLRSMLKIVLEEGTMSNMMSAH